MGFITNTFSVKKCVTGLRRKKGSVMFSPGAKTSGRELLGKLDPYIYEKLFLPILMTGKIRIKDVDIARISDDDMELLSDALSRSNTPDFLKVGLAFCSLEPAAQVTPTFI